MLGASALSVLPVVGLSEPNWSALQGEGKRILILLDDDSDFWESTISAGSVWEGRP